MNISIDIIARIERVIHRLDSPERCDRLCSTSANPRAAIGHTSRTAAANRTIEDSGSYGSSIR